MTNANATNSNNQTVATERGIKVRTNLKAGGRAVKVSDWRKDTPQRPAKNG